MNRTKSSTATAPNIGVFIGVLGAATARHAVSKQSCAAMRRVRPSAGVAAPAAGFIAFVVLPFGNTPRLRMRRNTMRNKGWSKAGVVGKADGCPAATFADASYDRATCSTIWLGDHLPGAHGASHARPDEAAFAMS